MTGNFTCTQLDRVLNEQSFTFWQVLNKDLVYIMKNDSTEYRNGLYVFHLRKIFLTNESLFNQAKLLYFNSHN